MPFSSCYFVQDLLTGCKRGAGELVESRRCYWFPSALALDGRPELLEPSESALEISHHTSYIIGVSLGEGYHQISAITRPRRNRLPSFASIFCSALRIGSPTLT